MQISKWGVREKPTELSWLCRFFILTLTLALPLSQSLRTDSYKGEGDVLFALDLFTEVSIRRMFLVVIAEIRLIAVFFLTVLLMMVFRK